MNQFGAVKAHGIFLFLLAMAQSLSAAPVINSVSPQPGFVKELGSVSIVFSEPVTGVQAVDFLINGIPAESVTGTGATYAFTFPQPAYGPVDITWGTLHTITSLGSPPELFDGGASGSTWAYQLIATNGPTVTTVLPIPGSTLRRSGAVEVSFTRPVVGVDASDLRVNNIAATNVVGVGAGPYRFSFPEASSGEVGVSWAPNHGIATDEEVSVPFAGFPWKYQVNTTRPTPKVVINEIMAENQTGIVDEEGDPEDWIELYNQGTEAVDLGGWSLSVDREEDGQWVVPPTTLLPGQFLLVWASGKDRPNPTGSNLAHTNFKLNPTGDTLMLYGPELPRLAVDELEYPEQAPNFSYGRQIENGQLVSHYLAVATPGQSNSTVSVAGKVDEVHFSVERGFFNAPFSLSLACRTSGAEIRYTLDGSPASPTNGVVYSVPIPITATKIVRAAAFAPNQLPSRVRTHTYLMNLANNRRYLPVLSLVTATNNLYGRTGIMEFSPRNTTKHGSAWERPVSLELIRPDDNGGFQLDAGIRVAGGDYIRGLYNYKSSTLPQSKYSFRLYFRGDYGPGRLNYRFFPESIVESFNSLHIRAGMNDPSNPFIKDEFVRELSLDTGLTACHGTFVYLFLNGVYKGLYNPCERVDDDFLQAYHGGSKLWDVIGPGNVAVRGDGAAWSQLRTAARKDLTNKANYLDVAARMDLPNFIDYLLPLLWADNDDWPHNNTRAAREKVTGSKFRFYPWDAEFAFGLNHSVSYDTIAGTLSSLSPPWGTTDYQAMFNSLKKSPEFKLLFADRVHRAFFNGGPLTDEKIRARYNLVKGQAAPSISGFDNQINSWITNRRRYVTNAFAKAGFLASSNAPVASQFGGRVPAGYSLSLSNLNGKIYYTTNGVDPRVVFTNLPSDSAIEYNGPLIVAAPLRLMARSLDGTSWSAVIDLNFEVTQVGSPIRITEIMYNPPGGDAFEFIELKNTSTLPTDVSGFSFNGINFRFPTPFPETPAGGIIVLASDAKPNDFRARYPNVIVSGWFGGSLANGGERIELIDMAGRIVTSVDYQDHYPWPTQADGSGASLEVIDSLGNPDDPGNWQASVAGGTPGHDNRPPTEPTVRINELLAGVNRDWLELFNPGSTPISLAGWSLTDNSDPRRHVFLSGTSIPAGGYYQVFCDQGSPPGGPNPSFALDRDGETISLYDTQTNRIDVLTFGPVVHGFTIGWVDGKLALSEATALAANRAAEVGPPTNVRINEFLANPDMGEDWIELHNIGTNAVALQGCSIVTSTGIAQIAATFIAPHGFTVFHADQSSGPNHLDLKLPAGGGLIALLGPSGEELDRVTYGAQLTGITTGRLPDGAGAFQQLPYSPTRGASNYLADLGSRLRISEVMARSASGPDWVEIENVSSEVISLSAYSLGVNDRGAPLVRLPLTLTQINPGERRVLYFGTLPPGFAMVAGSVSFSAPLNDDGSELTLRDTHDRIIDRVEYGLQLPDRSIGRVNQIWALLDQPSPGQANGGMALVDNGAGLRLNEWLAGGNGTNDFVEFYNPAALPVHLASWVLTDDPSIYGSTNNPIAPLNFIDAGGFVRFRTGGEAGDGFDHTSFRLDNLGETIRLLNPSGQVIDTIDFGLQAESVSEGRYPDGGTQIVKFPGAATPGAANALSSGDADHDGMDNAWELANGLDPTNPDDANADADQDGMSNLREFGSGTNPRDATSLFQIQITEDKTGQPNIHFIAQPLRTYRVEYVDELLVPSWKPLGDISASDTTRQIAIPDTALLQKKRFYRVVIGQ